MKKLLLALILLFVGILTACGYFGMKNLPTGEKQSSYESPDSKYTSNIYLCGGGATVDFFTFLQRTLLKKCQIRINCGMK